MTSDALKKLNQLGPASTKALIGRYRRLRG